MVFNFAFFSATCNKLSYRSTNEPLVPFVHAFHQHLLFRFVDKEFCVALLHLECLVHAVSV